MLLNVQYVVIDDDLQRCGHSRLIALIPRNMYHFIVVSDSHYQVHQMLVIAVDKQIALESKLKRDFE